jgi:hypothetical protein
MDVLAGHRDALGHLSVDQGFELAATEHDAQRLGFDDPIPVGLASHCPDEPKQLDVLRSMSIPHRKVPALEMGWPTAF